MKAIGYITSLPVDNAECLIDLEIATPVPGDYDLLVQTRAIAMNPVDTKVRKNRASQDGKPVILGWDVAGVVTAVGSKVELFQVGDEVWYAGDLTRQGGNAEYHLVDEKIAAHKPSSLSFEEAAALPLTSLTAWELLFDRLQVETDAPRTLLVTGAAGGVGSILIQLAKQLTQLRIIGTASRPDSKQWILDNGAEAVIDHSQPMLEQLQALGIQSVDYVISLTHTDQHAVALEKCLKPQGKFALIDDPKQTDFSIFKLKSISIHWEMMYTRSMFQTPDRIQQHHILTRVAAMVDEGLVKTTLNEHLGLINAVNLRKAHALLESGKSRGKIVLSGF